MRAETRKWEQSVWDIFFLLLRFEYGRIKFEDRILKVLKIKYRRENTRASFSDKPALPLVVLMKRLFVF